MFIVPIKDAIVMLEGLINDFNGFELEDLLSYICGVTVKYDEDTNELIFTPTVNNDISEGSNII